MAVVNNDMLWRHFVELTTNFLAPFGPYLRGATPSQGQQRGRLSRQRRTCCDCLIAAVVPYFLFALPKICGCLWMKVFWLLRGLLLLRLTTDRA